MNGNPKIERRRPKAEAEGLLTRGGVAVVLGVSVRTVDRMKAAGEIRAVTLRGWSVRFVLGEVLEAVRNGNRKFGRAADAEKLKAEILKREMGKDTDCTGNSQSPIADRRGGRDTNYGEKLKAETGRRQGA
jgi:excisionase family DNA binding protein